MPRPSSPAARRHLTPPGRTFLYGQPNASRLGVAGDVAAVLGRGSLPPLAPLRMHHSEKAGKTYLAYGCAHCRTGFFGDAFLELETVGSP